MDDNDTIVTVNDCVIKMIFEGRFDGKYRYRMELSHPVSECAIKVQVISYCNSARLSEYQLTSDNKVSGCRIVTSNRLPIFAKAVILAAIASTQTN